MSLYAWVWVKRRHWLDVSIWSELYHDLIEVTTALDLVTPLFYIDVVHLLFSGLSPITLRKAITVWCGHIISTSFSIPYLLGTDHWIDFEIACEACLNAKTIALHILGALHTDIQLQLTIELTLAKKIEWCRYLFPCETLYLIKNRTNFC